MGMTTLKYKDAADKENLTLNEQPKMSCCGRYYEASAEDFNSNQFLFRWNCIVPHEQLEDENFACDWAEYTIKMAVKGMGF